MQLQLQLPFTSWVNSLDPDYPVFSTDGSEVDVDDYVLDMEETEGQDRLLDNEDHVEVQQMYNDT